MLNGDDPSQVARDLYYLSAIGKARSQLVHEIETTLQRKQTLAAATQERGEALAAVEAKQKEQHGKLVAQREQRKLMLEKISAKIAEQRREIGNLQRDEKRLTQLIDRLAKMLAAKAAARKEARPTAAHRPGTGKPTAPELVSEATPEASSGRHFEQLRGSLRLPVRGTVTNRLRKLEDERVIVGYAVQLRPDAEPQLIRAWMGVRIEGNQTRAVIASLLGEPGVAALHDTNGRWDLLAELRAGSVAELSQVLERIRLVKGIANTETSLLLTTYR